MIDYEDDDLRTFLDNINKNEENAEKVDSVVSAKETGKGDVENFSAALDVSNDVRKLASRVDQLEVLNYGLWLMLEKKGFTNEEFNSAVAEAKDKLANASKLKKESIPCPKCGKLLQVADVFGIKCIYCGYESSGNPYTSENVDAMDEIPETQEYNVEDDLRFDEL